jgi:hypothetical protein
MGLIGIYCVFYNLTEGTLQGFTLIPKILTKFGGPPNDSNLLDIKIIQNNPNIINPWVSRRAKAPLFKYLRTFSHYWRFYCQPLQLRY